MTTEAKAKQYPFDITVKDLDDHRRQYTVTDKVTNQIFLVTTQKYVLKDIERTIFLKKSLDD